MRKHFDKKLYEAFDAKAKAEVLKLLPVELKACESPKKTDVDLMVYQGRDHLFNIEAEVKAVWVNDTFPFANIQFPFRKERYALLDKPTIFVMFNGRLNKYLSVTSKDLLASPIEMVRNKYVKFGEYFFQVPLNKVQFNDLSKSIAQLGV